MQRMRKQVSPLLAPFWCNRIFLRVKEKYVKFQFYFTTLFISSRSQKKKIVYKWRQIRFIYIANFIFSTERDFLDIIWQDNALYFFLGIRKMNSLRNLIFFGINLFTIKSTAVTWKWYFTVMVILYKLFNKIIILMRKLFNDSQSLLIPTAKHFLNLQNWHRLRFSRITKHFPSRRQRYSICFWMLRRKNPWKK